MQGSTTRILLKNNCNDIPPSLKPSEKNDPLCLSLVKLEDDYKKLMEQSINKKIWFELTEQQRLENEKAKIDIVEKVNKLFNYQYVKINSSIKKSEKPKSPFWLKLLYGFLMFTNLLTGCLGCYLGFISILSLIPEITSMAMIVIASLATLIEGSMMYSLMKPGIEQALSIKSNHQVETVINRQGHRLSLVNRLNERMLATDDAIERQGPRVYNYFIGMMKIINLDMQKIKVLPYTETKARKIFRYGMSSLSLLLGMAGIYFGVTMLITGIAASLVGTPIGWGIIGILIFSQLVTRILTRNNAIFSMLNPLDKEHKENYEKLTCFKNKSDDLDKKFNRLQKLYKQDKMDTEKQLTHSKCVKIKTSQECPAFFKPGESLSVSMRQSAVLAQPKRVPFNF